MRLSPLLLAVRAVSAEFAQRLFLPVTLAVGGIILALLIIIVWLVTISAWWWLLLAPLILVTVVFIFAVALTQVALVFLKPQQTKEQQRVVRTFVSSLQEATETAQTPKFLLLAYVIRDVLFPTKESFVKKASANAVTLKNGLKSVIASFS